jgi:hypothetical protein
MRAVKWAEMSFESFALGRVLALLPNDFPSIREARIQCSKLHRMLTEKNTLDKVFEAGTIALAGGSIKKWKKEQGKRAQQVGQQAKKVRALSDKVFKEFLRSRNPQLTNAEFRAWKKQFDSGMSQSKQKFMNDLVQKLALRP